MDPTSPPRTLVEQLNAFCQADVKSQWTTKRLMSSRDVCGFSYIENDSGEWIMMPTLCQNCYITLYQYSTVKGNVNIARTPVQQKETRETKLSNLDIIPSPLIHTQYNYNSEDNSSTDYLLYPAKQNGNDLELYRPSLTSNAGSCCIII